MCVCVCVCVCVIVIIFKRTRYIYIELYTSKVIILIHFYDQWSKCQEIKERSRDTHYKKVCYYQRLKTLKKVLETVEKRIFDDLSDR